MIRKWVAQGRNGYMGVDAYACAEMPTQLGSQHFPADYWGMRNNVFCIKPLKLGREVARAMNNAYWYGREDASIELIAAIKECIPDLEHYASTHGPGPDKRLENLVAIIERIKHPDLREQPS